GVGDHLGLNFITTVDDLAVLKRVVVQNVAIDGTAVLNAADPVVAAMAASCPGSVTYFAADAQLPLMATHRAQGHRVVYVDGDADHLGLNFITTVDDLAVLKRVVVQNVAIDGTAVLNAADPVVAAMAASCPGSVTYFAADAQLPLMATHRAQGHRVVYVDGDA